MRQGRRFFQDPSFEYAFLIALGRAYYTSATIGKVLSLAGEIEDGDFESAYRAFERAGDEARALAEGSERRGHRVSAREACMWAAGYYHSSTGFLDGTDDPSRFLPTWEASRACWDRAVTLFDPPGERVRIPYEGTALQGYVFRASDAAGRRPLLIVNNGSDGPGQGYALWKQGLSFRPDWEKVIAPVVDYALGRPDVDPKRIALAGISQGGYWVPRAVAFERRIAAAVADPGVVDVSTAWGGHLPPPMKALLEAGRKAEFDRFIATSGSRAELATLRFRMRPYGVSSPYDAFKAAEAYNLRGVAERIECPVLVTDPEGEQFWPGQSQALYDLVRDPKALVRFTAEEGAGLHCEPTALGLRDMRIFDWLDETLGVGA
ncbi:MAG TPA: prolyl oligopeptidase family serine peptidase [Thermodesulfobacteriota bacterium]